MTLKKMYFVDVLYFSVLKKQKMKKHLDEKKKKCKAGKVETRLEFPGREKVKFGEVVEAPPKLSFPKVTFQPFRNEKLTSCKCEFGVQDLTTKNNVI
ncbi:hypothetical protein TRIUR3_28907 [Triticum urartu]|uniref:Uncharacterized protein n=1 Tax=Triticum urartu TaxID=4572 RepID=M7ZEE7_TRIUA|nr:hypothetical protein TRIUR3_28907 [Triticum urartu]